VITRNDRTLKGTKNMFDMIRTAWEFWPWMISAATAVVIVVLVARTER